MSRSMIAGAAVLMLTLVAGCNSQVVDTASSRPAISATQACRSVGWDDNAINSTFIIVESNRDAGFTASLQISSILADCPSVVAPSACRTCGLAVIDEVYR